MDSVWERKGWHLGVGVSLSRGLAQHAQVQHSTLHKMGLGFHPRNHSTRKVKAWRTEV